MGLPLYKHMKKSRFLHFDGQELVSDIRTRKGVRVVLGNPVPNTSSKISTPLTLNLLNSLNDFRCDDLYHLDPT